MKYRYIVPNCCKEMKTHPVITLGHNFAPSFEDDNTPEVVNQALRDKPVWLVRFDNKIRNYTDPHREISCGSLYREAICCPYCGSKMPDLEPNPKPPKKIVTTNCNGYCATCHERHMCCECWDSVFLWRIKK